MKPSNVWTSIAAASAVALLVTACSDGDDSSENNDDNGNVDGIPASEMRDWDVDCDWFHLDDLQDFLGFEGWRTGPMGADHGGGSNPSALTCEGTFDWPEFEGPSGNTVQPNATFGYDIYPQDNREDADEMFELRVEHRNEIQPEDEATISGSVEGDWIESYYSVTEEQAWDAYFIVLQDEDFVMDFSIHIPYNPAEDYDESELIPDSWAGYEFDLESAAEFLFEEQIPNVHAQFMTLLERNG